MSNNKKDSNIISKSKLTLKRKTRLEGVVKSIESFGVLVDVGVDQDGILNNVDIDTKAISSSKDKLETGHKLFVWVKSVDNKSGKLNLTTKEPTGLEWDELKIGQLYKGKVTRIEKFGAFVDVGADRPGLVHISEITTGRLDHPDEVLKIAEEVEVEILGVNKKKRQINLSMKTLEQKYMSTGKTEEESVPTAMEIKLRAAMESDSNNKKEGRLRQKKGSSVTQDDILKRTLESRPKS